VERVITLKTDAQANDLGVWEYFANLLDKLTADGMSSEEESTAELGGKTVPIFRVKLCPWRAPEITNYLTLIDKAALHPAVRDKGNRPFPRIPSDQESSRIMARLPCKMYNQQWLADLKRDRALYVEKSVCVSEEAFELLEVATEHLDIAL